MTSHGVGGGSGLLSAFEGHKEVAEAGIHDKLHVTPPTQGVLPDLEILSCDRVLLASTLGGALVDDDVRI